jgi:hypothetical protein
MLKDYFICFESHEHNLQNLIEVAKVNYYYCNITITVFSSATEMNANERQLLITIHSRYKCIHFT